MKQARWFFGLLAAAVLATPGVRAAPDVSQQSAEEIRTTMSRASLLLRAGKKEDAYAMMRSLFRNGPPQGELALEYFRIVGAAPQGWNEAKAGLEKLARAEPGNIQVQWLLATHLASREPFRRDAIRLLAGLAKNPEADKPKVLQAWKAGLMELPGDTATVSLYAQFLAIEPTDSEVRERMLQIQRAQAERERKANDPDWRARMAGLEQLERGNLEPAQALLAQALVRFPKDAEVVGGLGLVKMRLGLHSEASTLFDTAEKLDADNAGKWKSLGKTAQFWGLLQQASSAREQKDLVLAERQVRAALQLEPENFEGRALLAGVIQDQGDLVQAERLYREVLRGEADNGSAVRGLASLLIAQRRRVEAYALLDSQGDASRSVAGKFTYIRAGLLRDDADELVLAGNDQAAMLKLREALLIAPDNPWVRLDLARIYQKDSLEQARKLIDEGFRVAPKDPQMLYAGALFLASVDQADDALAWLYQIAPSERSASIVRLQQRMEIQSARRHALAFDAVGLPTIAATVLTRAEATAGDDLEYVGSIANAWLTQGKQDNALRLLQSLMAKQSPPPRALVLRYASLLNRLEKDEDLSAVINTLTEAADWSEEDRLELRRLRLSLDQRSVDRQIESKQYDGARKLLTSLLERQPDHVPTQLKLVRVDMLRQDISAARKQIETLLATGPTDDLELRFTVADLLMDMPDLVGARRVVNQALTVAPSAYRGLLLLGKISRQERRYDEAMDYFKRAKSAQVPQPSAPLLASAESFRMGGLGSDTYVSPVVVSDSPQPLGFGFKLGDAQESVLLHSAGLGAVTPAGAEVDDEMERLERRREGWVAFGNELRTKPGTPGVSDQTLSERSTQVRIPIGYRGHLLLHADAVRVGSGTLQLDDGYALTRFGKVRALAPEGLASATSQDAQGLAIAVAYEEDNFRLDLGTTPQGFLIQDVVGGLKVTGARDSVSYSLDISRRALTSSLLAYAGTHDPVTDEVWGGVRSSGVDLRLSTDFGAMSASINLGYHQLNGTQVLGNSFLELRPEVGWVLIQNDAMRLSAGVALTHWQYKEDLSYYTFGHGGYYSPQSYQSVSFPWRWAGRKGRLTYLVDGSVSTSRSSSKDMPYYPTDPLLQALAGNPLHEGGSSTGTGFSLGGSVQYQVTPRLIAGLRFEMGRSAYYTPNSTLVYLRYLWDRQSGEIPNAPSTVRSYSRY